MTTDVFSEAEARYNDAKARRQAAIEEWDDAGSPTLTTGSTGQLVEHPLAKRIDSLDKLCDRLGQSARQQHRGPKPIAVDARGVAQPPSAKLRKLRAV